MKYLIVAFCVSFAAAAPADPESILRNDVNIYPDKSFHYNYETEKGIIGDASGSLKQIGKDEVALVIEGRNQYISPEGDPISLTYVSDENGYQPQGSHLPTSPPIPEAIQRALEYIAAHPYVEKKL